MRRAKTPLNNGEFLSVQRVLRTALVCIIASWQLTPSQAQTIDFDKQIAPILVSN